MLSILAGVMFIFTYGGSSGRLMPPTIHDDKLESSRVCEQRKAALIAGLPEYAASGTIIVCVD